ncbi:FtsB family cell division protein [Neoactinobaculum massilliense]|uniref:FtsB family cell division protein n=1 Tax=Neoactinobaculum massilliense TaxID=2364794 RepID=UPI001F154772|nr:septum formation initiator family protein [Neoactinobaculum massilliense]
MSARRPHVPFRSDRPDSGHTPSDEETDGQGSEGQASASDSHAMRRPRKGIRRGAVRRDTRGTARATSRQRARNDVVGTREREKTVTTRGNAPGTGPTARRRHPTGPLGDGSGASRRTAARPGSPRSTREQARPGTMRRAVQKLDRDVVLSEKPPRRLSMRLLWVTVFAALAIIIIAPTLTRYASQQEQLRSLRSELGTVQQSTEELQHELHLWQDTDYVKSQARARLGYVMPGERLYVVQDPNKGTAEEQLQERVNSVNRERRENTPWYVTLWDSISLAGKASDGTVDTPNNTPYIQPGQEGTMTPSPTTSPAATPSSGGATPADGASAGATAAVSQ